MNVRIQVANANHTKYAENICRLIEEAAKQRGTGIAKRDRSYIRKKMEAENSIIALDGDKVAGFCYIETWENKKYAANSGLIVNPEYRGKGLAKKIKARAFQLSREKYPSTKLFGITTSLPVMKINSDLGYRPVTFSELTQDAAFWNGCQSCPNFDILTRNERKNCLCTGMLFDPEHPVNKKKAERENNIMKYYRWVSMKQQSFLKVFKKGSNNG